jgi:isoleucyl-tRNA synthetase
LVREVVRRVQDLRKQADFQVEDRIALEYAASPRLEAAIQAHRALLAEETLSDSVTLAAVPGGERVERLSFDDETLDLGIRRSTGRQRAAGRG